MQSLFEVITSQTSYVKGLDVALTYFMKPLRDSGLATEEELNVLFSNMIDVYFASLRCLFEINKSV